MKGQDTNRIIEDMERTISAYFQGTLKDKQRIARIRNEFSRDGYFNFKNFSFLPREFLQGIHTEVHALLSGHLVNRDTTPAVSHGVHTVSQSEIAQAGSLIPVLYRSESLRRFLGHVAGDELMPCREQEQYSITRLIHPEDVHDWHWGDCPYTLLWIISAPDNPLLGDVLQYVPRGLSGKRNLHVWNYSLNSPRSYPHLKGDVYFLKSNTTPHHIMPVPRNSTRIILSNCWAAPGSSCSRLIITTTG